jgi:hypothetical protein
VLSRLNAFFLANVEEDLQGFFKFGPQLFGVLPVKVRTTVEPKNFTPKKIEFSVVFNLGVIAVQGHDVHGCTPCCTAADPTQEQVSLELVSTIKTKINKVDPAKVFDWQDQLTVQAHHHNIKVDNLEVLV